MGTDIRPELSKKNKYWLDKHRYYELKHFCLQYPLWKKAYFDIDGALPRSTVTVKRLESNAATDLTAMFAEARIYYLDKIDMVEKTATSTSPELGRYILDAVINGKSYDHLLGIPCCKDTYYDLYRRFFWLLSISRK